MYFIVAENLLKKKINSLVYLKIKELKFVLLVLVFLVLLVHII